MLYTYHHRYPYNASSPPETIPVSDLLDEMDNLFISRDFGQELRPHLILHITVGTVRAQHSEFKYAFVQITNQITRHIYINKMNGKDVTIVDPIIWIWKKKDDGLSRSYKNYKDGLISNILSQLKSDNEN
ncbi:unnamed protein product [Rotaria sordida]|uniref:Uncharacterized protein n=1 Tax=Rotaria sordida TaxID=392033 RepID=A0A819PGM2_9BILA|nr:unnamed protein product [Rotaria sordida]